MTNTIADIEKAKVILVTGSNTTENHPVISSCIKRAVKFKGARLIVIDPRRIKLTQFSEKWLRPLPGTNVAWINGLIHVIIKEKLFDASFVEDRTVNFDKLEKSIEKFTPDYVESITGIRKKDLIDAARLYGKAEPGSILYCMGITQHTSGTDNVKSLANLAMLCGNLGVEGGGVNPLRGQNNVQGACDLGGLPNVFTGYQAVTDDNIKTRTEKAWNVQGLSSRPGLTATEMIPAAEKGSIKSMYIMGENPAVSDPDTSHVEKCFNALDFLVVQDIFMTETAKMADVVLPSTCFAEKDGTFSNTERRIQRVRKAVNAPGKALGDWEIICNLANRMGYPMVYQNSREIMDEIASVTPSYGGITYERLETESLHWPCPDRNHPGTPVLHGKTFPCGKGIFHGIDYIPSTEQISKDYPLLLTTGRVLYHYHTRTMTMRTQGLNEMSPECFIEITPEDAGKYSIADGEIIEITSKRGSVQAVTQFSPKAVNGTVFMPFHFAKAAANKLTSTKLDPVSKIPELKVCAVKLNRVKIKA
jgi:formate dehydrogenase alpha subunit